MVRTVVILSLLAVACGPVVTVGASCTTRDECAPGQTCLDAPGGFCTKTCAVEGSVKDCPGGTVCGYFGASKLVCSTYCTTNADCRVNYQCAALQGTESAGKKACQPDNVTR